MLRVAAYCRVSTDKDDQANSFESQKLYFERKIKESPGWELAEIYADEGITGTNTMKRTKFNNMIRDAKQGKIDRIITKEVSRFARNTVDTLQYTRDLKTMGIGVLFINDNIDTLDSDGELRLTIMASIAQEESRKTSERVKWGQQRRMEQGVVFGRNILGYHLENGVLTVNEVEAKLVRHIFNKYLEGKGLHIIAKELQQEGYKTKNGNSEWTNKSIRTILQNEKYVGDLIQKKTYTPDFLTHKKKYNKGEEEFVIIKNHHEPIVDRKIFDFVQNEFKRKSEVSKIDKTKHSNRYAFSGKIICGCCGRRFVAHSKHRKDGSKRKLWSCYNKTKNGKVHEVNGEIVGCNNKTVGNEILESLVLQVLNDVVENRENIVSKIMTVVKGVIRKRENEQYDFEKTEKEIQKLESKKRKNIDAYYDNLISEKDFKSMVEQYNNEIERLSEEIRNEKEKSVEIENKEELISEICMTVTKLVSLEEFDDNIAKEVLDKIVVHNKTDIEVYLKEIKDRQFFFTGEGYILDNKYRCR